MVFKYFFLYFLFEDIFKMDRFDRKKVIKFILVIIYNIICFLVWCDIVNGICYMLFMEFFDRMFISNLFVRNN